MTFRQSNRRKATIALIASFCAVSLLSACGTDTTHAVPHAAPASPAATSTTHSPTATPVTTEAVPTTSSATSTNRQGGSLAVAPTSGAVTTSASPAAPTTSSAPAPAPAKSSASKAAKAPANAPVKAAATSPAATPSAPAPVGVAAEAAPDQTNAGDSTPSAPSAAAPAAAPAAQPAAPTPQAPGAINCRVEKCIALTFDDGPSARYTPGVLDTLKKYNAHGTFFVMGNKVASQRALLNRMLAEGHEIGNHTWDHPQFSKISSSAAAAQVNNTSSAIQAATGYTPTWIRPPYGDTGGAAKSVAANAGLRMALWNVDTLDWKNRNSAKSEANALKVKPGGIILMHDIHAASPGMLDDLCNKLTAKGYHLVTMTKLMDGATTTPGVTYSQRTYAP